MNTWAFISGLLAGWILGVWMSHRKIRAGKADHAKLLDLVRQHKELRELIDKEGVGDNVVDFPGNNSEH